jgi:hypothetical protein
MAQQMFWNKGRTGLTLSLSRDLSYFIKILPALLLCVLLSGCPQETLLFIHNSTDKPIEVLSDGPVTLVGPRAWVEIQNGGAGLRRNRAGEKLIEVRAGSGKRSCSRFLLTNANVPMSFTDAKGRQIVRVVVASNGQMHVVPYKMEANSLDPQLLRGMPRLPICDPEKGGGGG